MTRVDFEHCGQQVSANVSTYIDERADLECYRIDWLDDGGFIPPDPEMEMLAIEEFERAREAEAP